MAVDNVMAIEQVNYYVCNFPVKVQITCSFELLELHTWDDRTVSYIAFQILESYSPSLNLYRSGDTTHFTGGGLILSSFGNNYIHLIPSC
jgi:hypothetical protein